MVTLLLTAADLSDYKHIKRSDHHCNKYIFSGGEKPSILGDDHKIG